MSSALRVCHIDRRGLGELVGCSLIVQSGNRPAREPDVEDPQPAHIPPLLTVFDTRL
jgi:hypothetical protein